MLKRVAAIFLFASLSLAQSGPNLSGTGPFKQGDDRSGGALVMYQPDSVPGATWTFTLGDNRARGTVVLYQSGSELNGTWHTAGEKSASDTLVVARILETTVMLNRAVGGAQETYILTMSSDGNRLEGVGQGSLNHEKLIMVKTGPAPKKPQSAGPASKSTAGANASPDVLPRATKQKWMGIGLPPQSGIYKWIIQSVAVRSSKSGKKYSSYYYEVSTGRSVEEPLSLTSGGEIVGVFPDDCMFSVQDQAGHSFTFRNETEAQAHGLGPGTWSVYPLKCGGIEVYVR